MVGPKGECMFFDAFNEDNGATGVIAEWLLTYDELVLAWLLACDGSRVYHFEIVGDDASGDGLLTSDRDSSTRWLFTLEAHCDPECP